MDERTRGLFEKVGGIVPYLRTHDVDPFAIVIVEVEEWV